MPSRLLTLGRLALLNSNGHTDPSLATRPRKVAVLAWLALRPGRRATRDRLVGMFWSERDDDRARNSLSDALSHLRRVLGRDALRSQADEVLLSDEGQLSIDALELIAAAAADNHERVVALHAGPFLDGVYVDDAPEFDEWRDRERARFASLFSKSAAAQCKTFMTALRVDECRDLAARWLDVEPGSTDAALFLLNAINAPATHESRAAALLAYEALVRRLDRDIGAPPHGSVTALARDISSQLATEPAAFVSPPVQPASQSARAAELAAPVVTGVSQTAATVHTTDTPSPAPFKRAWTNVAYVGGALIVMSALTLASWHRPDPAHDARRVVVAEFENRTGDSTLALLGRMTADWMTRGLTETRAFEVLDPAPIPAGALVDALRVGNDVGAGTVVLGAYFLKGDSIGIEARIVDTRDGRVRRAIAPAMSVRGDPLVAISALRERVTGALSAEFDVVINALAREASQPPTYGAYLAYVRGIDLFTRKEFLASVPVFLRAASLDSNFVSPRIWAVAGYGNGGDLAHADSLARAIDESAQQLLPLDRGLLDFWRATIRGDRAAAYEAGRRMVAAAPASELALFVAGIAAIGVNRPDDAITYLRRIRVERSAVDWSSYGTRLASAFHMTGRFDEELVEARKRRAQAPRSLRAIEDEARALAALGRVAEVDLAMETVLTLPPDPKRGVGTVIYQTALEFRSHGHEAAAIPLFHRAAEWARSQSTASLVKYGEWDLLPRALYHCGDHATTDSMFRALSAARPLDATALGWVGANAAHRGEVHEAERISQLLATFSAPRMRGTNTIWRARIAAALGHKDEAVRLTRQAIAEGTVFLTIHLLMEMQSLRGYPPYEALVRPIG